MRRTLEALAQPELTYSSEAYGTGRRIFKRGALALAVHPETRVVITVLWSVPRAWDDEMMRDAMAA